MVPQKQAQLQQAYDACLQLVRNHYENFPVASLLLPKTLRMPIAVIYAFARTADDFADEGDLPSEERLTKLNEFEHNISNIEQCSADNYLFVALGDVVQQHQLPRQLFLDLLTAFKQDVTKTRYRNFDEVMNYCRYSANPVGRLLLHLTHQVSAQNLAWSDNICSALQLINFLQDIHQDYVENNRIYLPQDEMAQYGVTDAHIQLQRSDNAMRSLINQQLQRAKTMMLTGSPLGGSIPGRFGLQLRMMINGGLQTLKLLENQDNNYFSRPRLRHRDWLSITIHAALKQPILGKTAA